VHRKEGESNAPNDPRRIFVVIVLFFLLVRRRFQLPSTLTLLSQVHEDRLRLTMQSYDEHVAARARRVSREGRKGTRQTNLFRGCKEALVIGASKRTVCSRSPLTVSAAAAERSQMMAFQSREAVRR
jgi:hypothetical protein